MHTSESSRCGCDCAEDMIKACKKAGYSLVVVTDHFFNANINCPPAATWPEKIECLMRGYNLAKAEGDRIGVKVLFGWETNTNGPEILTYGLGRDFLMAHPDVAEWPLEEYCRRVKEAGAFIAHAHPYREAYYIVPFTPRPELYDAIEVFNYHNKSRQWDKMAEKLADRSGKLHIAGSDAHLASDVGGGAMELPWPVDDMPGLIEALRSGKARVVEQMT